MESPRSPVQLILALAVCLIAARAFFSPSPPAYAQEAGEGGVFAVTAPGQGQGNNVLYVIDSRSMRLLVYEHRAGGPIKLALVRNMIYATQYEQWPGGKEGDKLHIPPVKELKRD